MRSYLPVLLSVVLVGAAHGQQLVDSKADLTVKSPTFGRDAGPVVTIDAAHHNFHQVDGRFEPFANLLRNDGYRVVGSKEKFSAQSLESTRVLVVSNALNAANVDVWRLPTPSAFSSDEIAAVKRWVNEGGALLLIADHFPFAGAATDLGRAFGFEFQNAYARSMARFDVFSVGQGSLRGDELLRGETPEKSVTSVATFTGSAFSAPAAATPVLVLPRGIQLIYPTDADNITAETPRKDGQGLLQGAVMSVGKGRVGVFGEAAMFSAQRAGPQAEPMGFNAPEAAGNKQFILNLMRWLSNPG